jgi:hypothetical protein
MDAFLRGRARRQGQPQSGGFLQQLRVATNHAEAGAWWWTLSTETLFAVRADPAMENYARLLVH